MMVLWIILQRCTFLHVHVVWNYTHAFSMQQCINSFAHLLGFSIILSCNTCIHVEPVHIITCSFLNTVNQPTFICMQDTKYARASSQKSSSCEQVLKYLRHIIFQIIHILIAKKVAVNQFIFRKFWSEVVANKSQFTVW